MFCGLDAQRAAAVSYDANTGIPAAELIREHQAHHDQLKELAKHLRSGASVSRLPDSLRAFKKHMGRLKLEKDLIVFAHPAHGSVPVVARDWLAELAFKAHGDMAHIGRDKLCDLFKQRLFSPGLISVITDIVKTCHRCQLYKTSALVCSPPVQKIESESPFELVAVDIVMFPRSGRGHVGCLVAVDHCSKWAIAVSIRSKTSAAVAAAFQHRVLPALLKVPRRVLSDNGPEFRGTEFEEVLQDWNILHTYSTPHHPEGNGAVERCNRTIGQSLRLLTTSAGDWDLQLTRAMATYNGTRHAEIETSPSAFLLRHRHADGGPDGGPAIISEGTQDVWKPGHPGFVPFRVGETVKKAVTLPGNFLQNRFKPRYIGPLTVCKVGDNGITYLVRSAEGVEQRAHHSQLRPYYNAPSYLQKMMKCVRPPSKSRVTGLEGQAPGTVPASTATQQSSSQRIHSGVLTPVRPDYPSTGQRTVPTAAPPPSGRSNTTQSVAPPRGCLRPLGSVRAERHVRFDVSEGEADGQGPLHSSPFFRRSKRLRARTQNAASFEFWESGAGDHSSTMMSSFEIPGFEIC